MFIASLALSLSFVSPAEAARVALRTHGFADSTHLRNALASQSLNDQVQEFHATPDGQWILVSDLGVHASAGFPSAVLAAVGTENIQAVAVGPDGEWAVVTDHDVRISDFSLAWLRAHLNNRMSRGETIHDVVIDPDGTGWGFAASGGALFSSLDPQLTSIARDAQDGGRVVRGLTIDGDGDWVVVADNWYASSGVSSTLRRYTDGWQQSGVSLDHIALSPTTGYLRLSNETYSATTANLAQVEASTGSSQIFNRLDRWDMVGLTVAMGDGAGGVEHRGYGRRAVGTEGYVDSETIFDTASVSKTVAAAVTLAVITDTPELLQLDDTIASVAARTPGSDLYYWWYVGNLIHGNFPVDATVRQLMNHTSGLEGADEGFGGAKAYWVGDHQPTLFEVLGRADCTATSCTLDELLDFANTPGDVVNYSGGGLTVLQAVVEAVTDDDFETIAQDLVFQPLDMNFSSFEHREYMQDNMALQHEDGVLRPVQKTYWAQGAANLQTTPLDFGKFLGMIADDGQSPWNESVIDPDLIDEMVRPVRVDNANTTFGLGVRVRKNFSCAPVSLGGARYISHSGRHLGLRSKFVLDRVTGAWWMASGEQLDDTRDGSNNLQADYFFSELETAMHAQLGFTGSCIL